MRIQWLTEPSATLPETVEAIEILVYDPPESLMPDDTILTVANLEDRDDDGHREVVRRDLPTGRPIRIKILGLLVGDTPGFVAHVGPITFFPGERRYVDVVMYQLETSVPTPPAAMAGQRFLHTATALDDGRVLIAGGFGSSTSIGCPGSLPAESKCFDLVASEDAWLFDPPTGKFHPVQDGLLEPRGGHVAQRLPDGRVLLVGGAPRVTFALVAQGTGGVVSGYRPEWLTPEGGGGARATFEIFDPGANLEIEDVEGDGDPGAGGFFGSAAAPDFPGDMNQPRFLPAIAEVPGEAGRFLVAGGDSLDGTDAAARSFEVFDYDRPGGHGFYEAATNMLTQARRLPAAVGLISPNRVWILGGNAARSNDELAEIWTPDASDPNGSVLPATMDTVFPGRDDMDMNPHPEYSLLAPLAIPINRTHALVIGWMGARCAIGGTDVTFPADGVDTELCAHDANPARRSFVLANSNGSVTGNPTMEPHAFAAWTRLDDGRVAVSGGTTNLGWIRASRIEVWEGDAISSSQTAVPSTPPSHPLVRGRMFHTTTALREHGLLTVGGITFSTDLDTMMFVPEPEVIYRRN